MNASSVRGTGGRGTDILIETASSPKVWDYLLELMAARGRMSAFGLYPEASFQPLALIRKGVTLYGDVAFLTRHFIRAIGWLEAGKVSGQALEELAEHEDSEGAGRTRDDEAEVVVQPSVPALSQEVVAAEQRRTLLHHLQVAVLRRGHAVAPFSAGS